MQTLDRRELLGGAMATAVAAGIHASAESKETPTPQGRPRVIDTNVSLFQWPFRRLPLDEVGALVGKLHSHSIEQAWAGSFEGLLHRDVAAVNSRLAATCREAGGDLLVPFGSVNLTLPDWEEDLRRCHEEHRMPGIRLHPNYHGYAFEDPRFARLLEMAEERQLIVQIATAMEDTRTHHPLMQVADVDLAPLADVLKRVSQPKLEILNHKVTGAAFSQLLELTNVYFDVSRVNATDGVARVVRTLPANRAVFGSHAPFLIYESAMIKVYESDLTEEEASSVLHQNASRLMLRDTA